MLRCKQGFTLIEIMVVMCIVALLVSVALVEGVQFRKQANQANCVANLQAIASGFEVYAARHAGVYADRVETNLKFLIDDGCLFQDLVGLSQIGNFRYIVGSISPAGYDVRALAVNPALADHNFQVSTGGILKQSATAVASDLDFKNY